MKTAVHFGAGKIGRGFLGHLYWQSGWKTIFVDVAPGIVEAINREGHYTLQIIGQRCQSLTIGNIRAIHAADREAVAEVLADCDLASTAVGVRFLDGLAPLIAAGIERRAKTNPRPLNVVICENLLEGAARLRGLVLQVVSPHARGFAERSVGFVASVVSRMVPVVPPKLHKRDPLYVAVEPYSILPVDRRAFVGEPPAIEGMVPVENIHAHEERKLFCHNCGHALCAYPGHLRGQRYIAEAMADPEVRRLVEGGLAETGRALIARHGFDPAEHRSHVEDLLGRFANRSLGDTIERVAREPIRKLARNDRLVGAALLCLDNNVQPAHTIEGIRAALAYDNPRDPQAVELQRMLSEEGLEAVLEKVCGLRPEEDLYQMIREAMG